jgi:hypothetical protein
VFKAGLQSYLLIVITRMKRSTLQQHKEVAMLCEEVMTTIEVRNALLVPQSIKHAIPAKTQSTTWKIDKHCTNCGMTNHNVESCKRKKK